MKTHPGRFARSAAFALVLGGLAAAPWFTGRVLGPAAGTGPRTPSARALEIRAALTEDALKPRFTGTIWGWEVGPTEVIEAEGRTERDLEVACDPFPAGAETPTSLDFEVGYLPELRLESSTEPSKWLCDGRGLSVALEYTFSTPLGPGSLWIEQAVWGRRAVAVFAAADRVEAGRILERPAIFAHQVDDEEGLGLGQIIVIEDDEAPEFQILRLTADNGIPFAELRKIAEGVR
jgi:hypothetical protein